MKKTNLLVISAILAVLWVVINDNVVYWFESARFSNPCEDFASSVATWRQQEDGLYVLGNGVYIGNSVVLTNKHLADKDVSFKTILGFVSDVKVLKVIIHPDLDLAILILSKPLPLPVAILSEGMLENNQPPYVVSGLRNGLNSVKYVGSRFEVVNMDELLSQHEPKTMIVFHNGATSAGDSGGSLLDKNCRLIGLVSGGNHSFIGKLRPSSFYINLMNKDTLDWIIKSSG